jgi:hypothetical protein
MKSREVSWRSWQGEAIVNRERLLGERQTEVKMGALWPLIKYGRDSVNGMI